MDGVEVGFDVGVEEVEGTVGAGQDGDKDVNGHVCSKIRGDRAMLRAVLRDADGTVSRWGRDFGRHCFDWGFDESAC